MTLDLRESNVFLGKIYKRNGSRYTNPLISLRMDLYVVQSDKFASVRHECLIDFADRFAARITDGNAIDLHKAIHARATGLQSIMYSSFWPPDGRKEAESKWAFRVIDAPFADDLLVRFVSERRMAATRDRLARGRGRWARSRCR